MADNKIMSDRVHNAVSELIEAVAAEMRMDRYNDYAEEIQKAVKARDAKQLEWITDGMHDFSLVKSIVDDVVFRALGEGQFLELPSRDIVEYCRQRRSV